LRRGVSISEIISVNICFSDLIGIKKTIASLFINVFFKINQLSNPIVFKEIIGFKEGTEKVAQL